MLGRAGIAALAAFAFASPAHAQGKQTLMPGVTYEQGVQFTAHGPVAFHTLVAPKPDGNLYAIKPVLSNETILGREKVSAMQKRHAGQATLAGVNGDLFNWKDGHPSGALMRDGVLEHPPLGERSTIGIDAGGDLHVDRVKFFGTWRGTGQRRTLNGLNEPAAANQVVLFTPVFGATTPAAPDAFEAVLSPFGPSYPNADLNGTVVEVRQGGHTSIPPGGAVLTARGSAGAKLAAEAAAGTVVTTRLILQPDWAGMVQAIGGGPVLVRDGRPVFRALELFTTDQLQPRDPRTAVGQLADGRYLFLAVDGREPGYSTGMTNFELAQTMVRLGAVRASALDAGGSTTIAFDGTVLNRPSDRTGERPVGDSLDVFYYGPYAPPPAPDVLSPNGDGIDETAALQYKLVRQSTVTATLVGPGGETIAVDQPPPGELRQPGTYSFAWDGLDPTTGTAATEGRWTWTIAATDDTGAAVTVTRSFWLNRTLSSLSVAPVLVRLPPGGARLVATFTLAEPANAALRIEAPSGTILRTIQRPGLAAGTQSIEWDGLLPKGTRVHSGRYVAVVVATNAAGPATLEQTFTVRRVEPPKSKKPKARPKRK